MTVELHTLSNGLRIVTEYMPGLQSATLGLWVNAGARHETAAQNGVAHFLEHMAFKGTKRRSALQIAQEIEDVGGALNAYTSRDTTAYYARVLKNDVPLALDLIADIVLNPVFDPREIEIERGVILQEIGQANDTPDDIIFDWLQGTAYPDQPLGRPILGQGDLVKRFDTSDFNTFLNTHYGPDQLILSAAGAVDHDAIIGMAEQAFGHLTPRPQIPPAPGRFHTGTHTQIKDLEQAHFTLAFEGPGYRSDDFYTAQIYATALGGGMSSRLFQEAREKRGLCYTIFAQAGSFDDTGMLTIYAGTSGDDLPELMRVTTDELRHVADDLDMAELNRARAQLKAGMLMGLESPSARAERHARVLSIWGRIPDLSEVIDRLDSVSLDQTRDYGRAMVQSNQAAMALYGPVDNALALPQILDILAA
jgi:predicted Zn-dependent peptidase